MIIVAATSRGITRSLLPSAKVRATIAKRLAAVTGEMATATITEMDARHDWFSRLDARHRSWITLVAQAGIDGFVRWFADPDPSRPSTADVFGSAPRELARRISLFQTVELVRTTIEVVETQIDELMPRNDRPFLHAAIVSYSREVAFTAAEIYARAAELRGAWDARLEALVVDAVLRGETDETVLSRASTLGWRSAAAAVVVVGPAPTTEATATIESIRHTAAIAGIDLLGAVQGDRLVLLLGGDQLTEGDRALEVVGRFVTEFGPGPVVVGPPVDHLMDASNSTRPALSGFRAAAAWPEAPRPVAAQDLLPEAGPLRRRARPAFARPGSLRAARRLRSGSGRHPGHLLRPGSLGGGHRPGAVRAPEHRPLPAAPDRRTQRLQPDRRAGRLRPAARTDPGAATRAGCRHPGRADGQPRAARVARSAQRLTRSPLRTAAYRCAPLLTEVHRGAPRLTGAHRGSSPYTRPARSGFVSFLQLPSQRFVVSLCAVHPLVTKE